MQWADSGVLSVTHVSTCGAAGVAHKNESLNSLNKMVNTSQRHAQHSKLRRVYAMKATNTLKKKKKGNKTTYLRLRTEYISDWNE